MRRWSEEGRLKGKKKVRMRRDLSDHVAGANGVSNGVDQSLPALKHERANRLSPSLPRANAYSNNEPSIIVGIIIIAGSAVLVLLLPPGRLLVFRLYPVRGGSIQRLNET